MSYSDVSAIDARMKKREDGYRDEAITVRDDQLKRLTAMRQADLSRAHMGQGDPGDAPAPQAIPYSAGQSEGGAGSGSTPYLPLIKTKPPATPDQSDAESMRLARGQAAPSPDEAGLAALSRMRRAQLTGAKVDPTDERTYGEYVARQRQGGWKGPATSGTPDTNMQAFQELKGKNTTRTEANPNASPAEDARFARVPAPTASAGATLNVRNNNPGNLKFAGQAGARPGPMLPDGTQFAVFDTPEAGVAANVNQLRIYGTRGINTVEKIINTWSPATAHGNTPESTANYIAHVSKALGVAPNQPLDMANPQVLQAILRAQAPFEGGQGAGPSQTTQAQPTPGGIISNANAATPAQFTPAQFFSAREQVDQQTKMATLRLQQLREMAAVTRDPAELQKLHDQAMGLQSGLHEAQIYRVAAQAGAGNEGALSQLVQMMGGVGVARTAQGYVLVDPASGRATTAPLRPDELAMKIYGHLSASARAQAAASSKERDKAMYKAQGDMAVESVKNQGLQKLEEMKANQAISEAILKNQLTSGDIMGVETNPVNGQTIVRTKRGVFAVSVEASKFDQKPTPKLVPITQ